MIVFRRKRARSYQRPIQKNAAYIVAGAFVLMLVVMLSLLSAKRASDRALGECREVLSAGVQQNLFEAIKSYDGISLRSADLTGEILPSMRRSLYAADALNRAMVQTFGDSSSLYDMAQYEAFQAIMAAFDDKIAAGQSTDDAKAQLSAYMAQMESVVAQRLGPEGLPLSKTANQPTP